jgi:hypothetical protein
MFLLRPKKGKKKEKEEKKKAQFSKNANLTGAFVAYSRGFPHTGHIFQ